MWYQSKPYSTSAHETKCVSLEWIVVSFEDPFDMHIGINRRKGRTLVPVLGTMRLGATLAVLRSNYTAEMFPGY